jgi:ubiquitin carboxyl-terminal hydrolase 10
MPPRASKNRKNRRRKTLVPSQQAGLALPSREQAVESGEFNDADEPLDDAEQTPTEGPEESLASTVAPASEADIDTPSTSHPPSEADLTHPANPSPTAASSARPTPPAHSHTRTQTKPVVPLIPIRSAKAPSVTSTTQKSVKSVAGTQDPKKAEEVTTPTPSSEAAGNAEETPKASPSPAAPKSWAELLRSKAAPAPVQTPAVPNGNVSPNGPPASKSNSLGDVLASFSVDSDKKLSFLEPRGLVNTGNVCYMNSVGPLRSSLSWPPFSAMVFG